MRIKVHPLFVALAVALVACGQALPMLWTFFAVSLHEGAHALAARARGYVLRSLVLLPFGAVLASEERMDGTSAVIVGAAGPAVNLLLCAVITGIWWVFPATYTYTQGFLYANLSLAIFNVLPVYPLDGSRVVLGFAKNKIRAVKAMRVAGVAVSFAFLAAFIASFFFGLNFTFGIIAVFLFYGATYGSEEQSYVSVFSPYAKDYSFGVERKKIAVLGSVPIARLFRFVNPSTEVEFSVVDEDGRVTRRLSEDEVRNLAVSHRLSVPITAALENPQSEPKPKIRLSRRGENTAKAHNCRSSYQPTTEKINEEKSAKTAAKLCRKHIDTQKSRAH